MHCFFHILRPFDHHKLSRNVIDGHKPLSSSPGVGGSMVAYTQAWEIRRLGIRRSFSPDRNLESIQLDTVFLNTFKTFNHTTLANKASRSTSDPTCSTSSSSPLYSSQLPWQPWLKPLMQRSRMFVVLSPPITLPLHVPSRSRSFLPTTVSLPISPHPPPPSHPHCYPAPSRPSRNAASTKAKNAKPTPVSAAPTSTAAATRSAVTGSASRLSRRK